MKHLKGPNPAGSKLLRQWYKAKIGKRGTYVEALCYEWGPEPRFRVGENKTRIVLTLLAEALRGGK